MNLNATEESILSLSANSDKMFFGDSGHGIARYDVERYPIFGKINQKMRTFFWLPNEIDVSREMSSFAKMSEADKFVFTANLRRQILLDTVQGRAPSLVFLPHCSDPSLENCILTWGFMESIHSESYTHIIRAIYPDPSKVFEEIPNISPIADCAKSISNAYDNMVKSPSKENLYLALVAANALEAIRFYVSFACTFSFLERGLVEGSSKIVKYIARDEAQHLSLTQHILKLLPKDDKDFIQIIEDFKPQAEAIFQEAAEQEKSWARYLFSNGPILGLSEKVLCDYVDYLLLRRAKAIGLSADTSYRGTHPIPWVEKHFSSSNTQVAPQEVEIASYLANAVENDANSINFEDFWKKEV
jgi:ribonucleoside-diphosphate reductase beta chain